MPEATPAAAATGTTAPPPPAPGSSPGNGAIALTSEAVAPKPAEGAPPAATDAAATKGAEAAPKEAEAKAALPADIELKFPDGVQVDAAELASFKTLAKEKGFSPEQTQAIADFASAQRVAQEKADAAARTQTNTEWAAAVKAHPNFPAYQQAVAKVMQRYGSAEVHDFLNGTHKDSAGFHFGSHPVLHGLLARIGADLSEDSVAIPGGASAGPAPSRDITSPEYQRQAFPSMFPKE